MPRKKRSEIIAEGVVKPAPVAVAVAEKGVQYTISATCPVCGKSIVENRAIKAGHVTVDHIGYFASIDWDANKPFGVEREATGRGSFTNWRYLSPEDAPEFFEAVKARFLQALKEWQDKQWISPKDLEDYIRSTTPRP